MDKQQAKDAFSFCNRAILNGGYWNFTIRIKHLKTIKTTFITVEIKMHF